MRSNIFKPLSFLPARHHLNRWAFGYYLVKIGFSNAIVQNETSFSYKQVRKIRADLSVNERRGNCYGQDIMSSTDLIKYSAAVHIYCELREKLSHIESVINAYNLLRNLRISLLTTVNPLAESGFDLFKEDLFAGKADLDISGFYRACEEISTGEAVFVECKHCKTEIFSGPGLRDKVISHLCPSCETPHWEQPKMEHRLGHIATRPKSGDQQPLF